MDFILTAIAFILIFSVLILVHEFGHFIMAKRAGIKVEEFGFGLPPRIWGKKKGETIYSINWIPFGGFVRMLGESATEKGAKLSRSFAAKSIRKRVKVVIAGVVMNFILAWLLLSIGFSVGMDPLITADNFLPAIQNGQIEISSALKIKDIEQGSLASEIGLQKEDTIYALNGEPVSADNYTLLSEPFTSYTINRDGEMVSLENPEEVPEEQGLGVTFYDFVPLPRIQVYSVNVTSNAYRAGLRAGDTILSVNDQQVFSVEDYERITRGETVLEFEIYRDGEDDEILVETNPSKLVVISRVLDETPAKKAGLLPGDVILAINGVKFYDSQALIDFVSEHQNENLLYDLRREGREFFVEITPEEGKIGVLLSELREYGEEQEISVYNVDFLTSVTDIKDEQYIVPVAMYKSFTESFRLSYFTVSMFKDFIKSLVQTGEVPGTVAGPVGIAQMTHGFVQEGIVPLLRFVALLSLSLAVINILPLPALDGGRLLFILIELIVGRKVNPKWESSIHALGYVLILLLILAVTYSDILRLIGV